jgi:probable DNA metabolism protein
MSVQQQFEILADAAWQPREVCIRPTFASWRNAARLLLREEIAPQHVAWHESDKAPASRGGAASRSQPRHVPKAFLRLGATVACHRDADRWSVLYRVLWRMVHGERDLLRQTTDPDIARLVAMDREVRRAQQRMFATLRFQGVESAPSFTDLLQGEGSGQETGVTYVAWCEPAHNVVERAAPLLVKRFGDMRWSILSPDACAHWNGITLRFTPGLSEPPTAADITGVLQRGFTGMFTPSRVSISPMRTRQQPSAGSLGDGSDPVIQSRSAFAGRGLLSRLARGVPGDGGRTRVGARATPPVSSALLANDIGDDLDVPGAWDPTHDPGALAARRRAAAVRLHASEGLTLFGAPVRIGTASWCDPTIVQPGVFYPDDVCTPDARLQYYAERYPLVAVESTFHTPPSRTMAAAWAARSPEGFVFDLRAFALMTGYAADTRVLPDWLRDVVPEPAHTAGRVHAHELPESVLSDVWQRFVHGVQPLRDAGKLGPILLQYPRTFVPSRESVDELAAVRTRLGDLPAAVEFRNPAWVTGRAAARTFALLEELRLTYTVVDTPQGTPSSLTPTVRITTPELVVVRLHGRRKSTWEAGHAIASERRRYLYDRDELAEWAQRVMDTAGQIRGIPLGFSAKAEPHQGVHVIQNNCHANYAATNADELVELLIELDCERLQL